MIIYLFLDTDQDINRDIDLIAGSMLLGGSSSIIVSYVENGVYLFDGQSILKSIRLTKVNPMYDYGKVCTTLKALQNLNPDTLVVYVSVTTFLSEKIILLLSRFKNYILVYEDSYKKPTHLPDIMKKVVSNIYLCPARSTHTTILKTAITSPESFDSVDQLYELKNNWKGYDAVDVIVRKVKKKIITKNIVNRKTDIVEILCNLYETADTQIGERLKKVIDRRCEKNLNYLTDILDYYKYISDIEFNDFIKKEKTDTMIRSEEILLSSITLSSWYDELENHGCIGLVAQCATGFMGKLGRVEFKKFIPGWELIGAEDFLYATSQYFKKYSERNLNNIAIMRDRFNKPLNCMLPLYINKVHWGSAKKYIYPLFGLMMSHNPLGYTHGHLMGYFISICRYITACESFEKYNLLFGLWRTCYEIGKEEGYLTGLKNCLSLIKNFRYPEQYEMMLGQSIVVFNLDDVYDDFYQKACCAVVEIELKNIEFIDELKDIPDEEFLKVLDELWDRSQLSERRHIIDMSVRFRLALIQYFKSAGELASFLDKEYSVMPEKTIIEFIKLQNEIILSNDVPPLKKRQVVFSAVARVDIPEQTTIEQLCSMRKKLNNTATDIL